MTSQNAGSGMEPFWEHDCDQCEFVAKVMMPNCAYDWYIHRYEADGSRFTLMARHGNDGPDYVTPFIDGDPAIYTHVGSGTKSYSANELIAYALKHMGLLGGGK